MFLLRTGSPVWIAVFVVAAGATAWLVLSGRIGGGGWVAVAIFAGALLHHGWVGMRARRDGPGSRGSEPPSLRHVSAWEEVEPALGAPTVLLFKHSPACPISARARRQVWDFAADHPELPVVQVDVLRSRETSLQVARTLAVEHESPQLLVLRDGRVREVLNHGAVTRERIRDALGGMPESSRDEAGAAE